MKKAWFTSDQRITLEQGGAAWLPIHPVGWFSGNGVKLFFDPARGVTLPTTGLPLDYHHSTVEVEEGRRDKAPRVAQIMRLEVRDNYVYGLAEDWVADALLEVEKGEFGFVSPVLYHDDDGTVTGYHSFALTNRPGIEGQRRIGLEGVSTPKGVRMEEWLKLLGLAPETTPEALRAALEALNTRAAFGDAVAGILTLEAKNTPEARARVMKLVALEGIAEKLDSARAALEAQSTLAQAEKVETAIKVALEQGKIFEPERVLWQQQLEHDFPAARIALEAMPRRVPTTTVNAAPDSSKKVSLEAGQQTLNSMLGIKPEAFAKYGGE